MIRFLCALLAIVVLGNRAQAQISPGSGGATVVTSCGTPPSTYNTGQVLPLTQDTGGNLCSNSATLAPGSATAANQVLEIAALNTIISQAIPSCSAAPILSTSAEATHILKGSSGTLCGIYATSLVATNAFLMVFNATTAPGDGAVTPTECVPISPNGVASISYGLGAASTYSTGISVAISSTGCFTKTTTGMTAFFHGQVL